MNILGRDRDKTAPPEVRRSGAPNAPRAGNSGFGTLSHLHTNTHFSPPPTCPQRRRRVCPEELRVASHPLREARCPGERRVWCASSNSGGGSSSSSHPSIQKLLYPEVTPLARVPGSARTARDAGERGAASTVSPSRDTSLDTAAGANSRARV